MYIYKNDKAISPTPVSALEYKNLVQTSNHSPAKIYFDASTQTLDLSKKNIAMPKAASIELNSNLQLKYNNLMQQQINIDSTADILEYHNTNAQNTNFRECSGIYDYTINRQHYTSGDSSISVGRAVGLDSLSSYEDEADEIHQTNQKEDADADQMNSIITMGLDLADEHSRSSFSGTVQLNANRLNICKGSNIDANDKNKFIIKSEEAVTSAAIDPLFIKLFPQRHSSGNSSDSGIGLRIQPDSCNNPYNNIQSTDTLTQQKKINSISPTQSEFNTIHLNGQNISGSTTSVTNSCILANSNTFQLHTAEVEQISQQTTPIKKNFSEGISAVNSLSPVIDRNVLNSSSLLADSLVSSSRTINSNAPNLRENNPNFYVSYSQLHQQIAQQHNINLNDVQSESTSLIDYNENDYNKAINNYNNNIDIVQQFMSASSATNMYNNRHLYENQQQQSNFLQQNQQQLYQQFFSAEQLLIQQQQQQQVFSNSKLLTSPTLMTNTSPTINTMPTLTQQQPTLLPSLLNISTSSTASSDGVSADAASATTEVQTDRTSTLDNVDYQFSAFKFM